LGFGLEGGALNMDQILPSGTIMQQFLSPHIDIHSPSYLDSKTK
jgi:hypothetical protein